jgi:hypothetical protein
MRIYVKTRRPAAILRFEAAEYFIGGDARAAFHAFANRIA